MVSGLTSNDHSDLYDENIMWPPFNRNYRYLSDIYSLTKNALKFPSVFLSN